MTWQLGMTLVVAGLVVLAIVVGVIVKSVRAAQRQIDLAVAEIDLGREIEGWGTDDREAGQ